MNNKHTIDRIFTSLELFIKELFGIINTIIKNGMGCGKLIIIILHCTAARAAISDTNGALSLNHPNGLNNQTLPGAFSTLGAGERTTIFEATAFTKTYIMNLGNVEEKLIETINKSQDAISV